MLPTRFITARALARSLANASVALAGTGLLSATASAGTLNNKPDMTILGAAADNQMGGPSNAQGDLNGDGFKDLIVSSNTGPDQRGRIEVYYGSRRGISSVPGFSYEGPMDWAQVGSDPVVADVNGDGWIDLVVGATNYSGAQEYTGAVLVFLGSAQGLPATPSQVIEGSETNSFFGFRVRLLGDFNGDHRADIAVSALGADNSVGRIMVYPGAAGGLEPTPVSTLTGEAPWTYFGRIMDTGDINGDGIADIVVGMTRPVPGIPGMAWVYAGSTQGYSNTRSDTLFAVNPPQDGDLFGDTVVVLGDVDGDGYNDVAVGAPTHTGADLGATGMVDVYYGSAAGLTGSGRVQTLSGDAVPRLGMLGGNLLGNRDMNGDGYPDMLAGPTSYARPNDESTKWPGSVWVYDGGPNGLPAKPRILVWGQRGSRDELGTSLEAAQVMGGKTLDLIAGSALYSADAQHQGIVRIYRGANLPARD